MSDFRFPRVGLGTIVVHGGKVLLGHRISTHGTGMWGFAGGHLEFGESFEECAIRECDEECGLKLRDITFYALTNDVFEATGKHYITIFMRAEVDDPTIINKEPDKHAEWKWFAWDNLPSPLFLPIPNLLKQGLKPPTS